MADFDTPEKRYSGMGMGACSNGPLLPLPTGSVDQGDWYHFLDLYVGGYATEPDDFSLLPLVGVGS